MTDLLNLIPSLLLGAMITLTLLLLPLLQEDDRQRTDALRLPQARPSPKHHDRHEQ